MIHKNKTRHRPPYSELTQRQKNMYIRSVRKVRDSKKAVVDAYKKERGCCVCGERDPIVLDFHHRDEDLKDPVLKRRRGSRSFMVLGWGKMLEEMEKCDVMCANCHRRHTYFCRKKV